MAFCTSMHFSASISIDNAGKRLIVLVMVEETKARGCLRAPDTLVLKHISVSQCPMIFLSHLGSTPKYVEIL
jgi:hypothetical protein